MTSHLVIANYFCETNGSVFLFCWPIGLEGGTHQWFQSR